LKVSFQKIEQSDSNRGQKFWTDVSSPILWDVFVCLKGPGQQTSHSDLYQTSLDLDKCKNKLVKIILRLIAHGYKDAMNFKAEEKLKSILSMEQLDNFSFV